MTEENVEIVKDIYAAWGQGDFSSVDWADPEIEFSLPGPDPPERGAEAMGRAWAEWLRQFSDLKVIGERFHDAGDQVVVTQGFRGEGKGSGISIDDLPASAVAFTLAGGKVTRFKGYMNTEQALADVGVSD